MSDKTDEYFERLDAALAALASGARVPVASRLPDEGGPDKAHPTEEDGIPEALIEELTRRVIERLAPAVARDVVVQVVSEVAERLVREEIVRIRNKHV